MRVATPTELYYVTAAISFDGCSFLAPFLPTNLQSWHVDSAKVIEPAPETITVNDDGGLSDFDEMNGSERLAAITVMRVPMPPHGKKRLSSEVSLLSIVML